ncbi:MAG: dockerin type I domain-containing protein, partial [Bacteroidales bacterium]
EPVMGQDLSAMAITGNVTPSVGEATNYTVKFQNAGADPVAGSAYTVKLFKEGGVLQNSVPGVDIAPAEIKTIVIPWTPGEAGPTYIYGYIDFPEDDVPGNNTTGHLNVAVQPEGVIAITIGEGTNMPTFRIPFDFYWRNSIAQTLYFADEIGLDAAVLTAIKYTNNFQTNLPAKEVKILVGETTQSNLTAGWIDPTGFIMVYDGVIDFPSGENTIMIPLTTPYEYSGGNLVVITNRVYEGTYHSSLDRFYCTEFPGSGRNRYIQSDATTYNPWQIIAGTTLSNWAPNTTLFFSAEGPEILPGDANGDGVVTIMDVIAILNYMLGQNPQPFVFENADVNGDGQITVIDVIETLNIILSDGKTLAPVNSSDANIYLNSNNITLQSDGTLAGLQFELTGIEKLNFALNGYQFLSNVVNGKLIGVIFSFDNTPLPAGEITLFTFNETSGLKWGQVIGGNVNAENVQINKFQNSEFHLVVFPNPAKEVLNVQSNETINFIRLINQIGQVVEESVIDAKNYVINPSQANGDGGPKASYVINASNYALIPSQSNGDGGTKATYVYDASNYVINTSGLSKGVYILEVHTRNNVSVQKIVIE